MIIIGALLAGFSVACILLPNDAIDYGTAGIAILISKFTGINLSLCVWLVFLPFLILGGLFIGRSFVFRAILGSGAYSIGLAFFEKIPFELNVEHFIAVAFGGAILGIGLSLILRFGGCIDGSEILANIIVSKLAEKNKNISMTGILVAFNLLVYVAAFILISQNAALLSLLVYIVATAILDHFTDRFEAIKKITIITKNPDQITMYIKNEMHKTCTVMNSEGLVAGSNKTLIFFANYFELQKLREIIANLDERPFITVSTIDEIL